MNLTPKEQFDYFWKTFINSSLSDNLELKVLLEQIYTISWFNRNGNEIPYGSNWSLLMQFPLNIPEITRFNKTTDLLDYFIILSRFINSIGLSNILSSKSINGLIALDKSFQAFFELKTLTFIEESGFTINELDVKTNKKKDVEAKVSIGNWESLIECKVLGLSDLSFSFYKGFDIISGFVQYCVFNKTYFFGELKIKNHFDSKTWGEILHLIKKAIRSDIQIKKETEDYNLIVQTFSDEKYVGFTTSETFPTHERIKSTIKKTISKFRGAHVGILICGLPIEVGQGSAVKYGAELLKNNKY